MRAIAEPPLAIRRNCSCRNMSSQLSARGRVRPLRTACICRRLRAKPQPQFQIIEPAHGWIVVGRNDERRGPSPGHAQLLQIVDLQPPVAARLQNAAYAAGSDAGNAQQLLAVGRLTSTGNCSRCSSAQASFGSMSLGQIAIGFGDQLAWLRKP